jgi:hypothetical protein
MNSKRALQTNESAFYSSPAGKAESLRVRNHARAVGGGLSKPARVWFGFVRCRNALISKPSRGAEGSDTTPELPGAGSRPAPPSRRKDASRCERARHSINKLTGGSHSPSAVERMPDGRRHGGAGLPLFFGRNSIRP